MLKAAWADDSDTLALLEVTNDIAFVPEETSAASFETDEILPDADVALEAFEAPLAFDDAALETAEEDLEEPAVAPDYLVPDSYEAWLAATTGLALMNQSAADASLDGALDAQLDAGFTFTRLSGLTQYDTMKAIVDERFEAGRGGFAVVASGVSFQDALSASGLAGALDAPILLTDPYQLSTQTRDELLRLQGNDMLSVIIIGGSAAVSETVMMQIAQVAGGGVSRIWGNDWYDTAREVYLRGSDFHANWGNVAVICTGQGFADALSASPFLYARHEPVFLCKNCMLDPASYACVTSGHFNSVVILGGTAVVSEQLEWQLAGFFGWNNVDRLCGQTLYDTSLEIAKCFSGYYSDWYPTLTLEGLAIATGKNFPDALAGAALCGQNGSILALVDEGHLWEWQSLFNSLGGGLSHGYIFGGTAVVSEQTANSFAESAGTGSGFGGGTPTGGGFVNYNDPTLPLNKDYRFPQTQVWNPKSGVIDYMDVAFNIAADDAVGYQWGGNLDPGVDCSGFVYWSLVKAGYQVGDRFWTGNMGQQLIASGRFVRYPFKDVRDKLQFGDILVDEDVHTSFVWDPATRSTIEASGDIDGYNGDGNGKEICINVNGVSWMNWDYVYRLR